MAESCTVSNSENKRSLPAWMLKATSGNQVAKTEDQNKQALESDEQIGALNQSKPVKRNNRRPLKSLDSGAAGELGVLRRCEGREKARRKGKDGVKDEVEEIVEVKSKNVRKASGRAAPKNSRKRKLDVNSEPSSPVSTDDDIELTVEDLVNIAEEFVNADKQKQCELEAVKATRQKEHLLCPTISTEADKGQSVVNAQSVEGLMQCTTVTRNTRAIEYTEDENTSHQEVQCPSSIKTTEDVAQDMITLLFGHLLSKPAGSTKKSDPVESMTRTINQVPEEKGWHSEVPRQEEPLKKSEPVESMTSTINHVPEKKDWRSEVPKLGEPVTKKKSSLRDKVALFM
ncbi:hypothetical protein BDA96_01G230000 [Sorghum bicolor]|uniref:Uncharacterized protein n=2 Tax=Sorghum bicolor TaxID=4558 RepID=A0A921RZ62_SORBI|nr:uncharacterized protein LOC8067403 [Sorghum bicolor]XP_021310295.1 uncharacterized protein LOC8067403 [Sorghum bicolor]EER91467.1 hypothetical protein SORBI_3001G216100 [Sorghum bicolor]KAG0549143.1 hypothetical protein BDA96_01G230000 [Sorghum bicolor]KAG0549144.1 hypothetical protein BDA96_01G230000 [Sorghum bicolor]|eukprot:XP_002464469.1 uncharacterized protein LOC8067403 [Sorghum bicolor]